MNRNKFWAAVGRVLAVVTVTLLVILMLAPGAVATSKYKVLYKFTGGADGDQAWSASLIFDAAGNLYGTTMSGGKGCPVWERCGVVFELTPNPDGSWTESCFTASTAGTEEPWYLTLSSTQTVLSTAPRSSEESMEMAPCSSYRPTPTAAGQRTCFIASQVVTMGAFPKLA